MIQLTRLHPSEPLLKARNLEWEANGILNPGVTVHNGTILLLYRAIGNDNISRLGVVTSQDGVSFDFTSDKPVFSPENAQESLGVEDPRITFLDGKYGIMYVAVSSGDENDSMAWKTQVSLAWTEDFHSFDRKGIVLPGQREKNAALFPVRWSDSYRFFHQLGSRIALAESRDLLGKESLGSLLLGAGIWEASRVGIASPPLYTEDGWVVFYNARNEAGVYRIGVMLCDYAHPEKVIAKLPYPLLSPELAFEAVGTIPNIVYSCGAVEAGDAFWLYYGGASMALGGAFVHKDELLTELKKHRV